MFIFIIYIIRQQDNLILFCRLYSSPKDWSYYDTLTTSQAYEKVMKNNVDLELSFNSWDISIEKTLNTSKSAIFADSLFFVWGPKFLSKQGIDLTCLVRKLRGLEVVGGLSNVYFTL